MLTEVCVDGTHSECSGYIVYEGRSGELVEPCTCGCHDHEEEG